MSDLEEYMEEERIMSIKQKIQFHKHLAYSFIHMAKANKIGGHIGLHRQYFRYAREHVNHAKRLKGYLENGVRITVCVPVDIDKALDLAG